MVNDEKARNLYNNMMNQIDKIMRHANQGSVNTRFRYYESVKNYCKFVTKHYGLQKFTNTKARHVEAWVEHMKTIQNLAPKTIKSHISGLRYFYDQAGGKNHLPDNEKLNLESTPKYGVDRAWTEKEYQAMLARARDLGRQDVIDFMRLGREAGLRIHEIARLDRATAEKAVRTGLLTIKGKGGLIRTFPLRESVLEVLKQRMAMVGRGEKLFVERGVKTHTVIKSIQNFIYHHRKNIQEDFRVSRFEEDFMRTIGIRKYNTELTFHGLRHTFAREELFKNLGLSHLSNYDRVYALKEIDKKAVKAARLEVAKKLGHGRDDVTKVYTAGV